MKFSYEKQQFETGRVYNGPQVLAWKLVSATPDSDPEFDDLFDLVVYMVDDSRSLAYELRFYMRDAMPTGREILDAYDRGGNRELMLDERAYVFEVQTQAGGQHGN